MSQNEKEFQVSCQETGSFIYDDDDENAFHPSDEFRLNTQKVQIKKAAWHRWKDLDIYLTGCVCAPRDGDFLNLCRDNLIPCQAAWMKYR